MTQAAHPSVSLARSFSGPNLGWGPWGGAWSFGLEPHLEDPIRDWAHWGPSERGQNKMC